MKKIFMFLLISMCFILLSGCGKKNDSVSSIANIKINVDQQTMNEANQAIKETQKKLNGN